MEKHQQFLWIDLIFKPCTVKQMYGKSKMVQEELEKEGLRKALIIVVGKKNIYSVDIN